jgi:hypothetical protein
MKVTVAHGVPADQPGSAVHIETAHNEQYPQTEYSLARRELERWLCGERTSAPTDRSDAGLVVGWRTSARERRKQVAKAVQSRIRIQIDDELEQFTVVQAGTRWVAVCQRTTETITISAQDTDPAAISLKVLARPVDELLGHVEN